MDVSSRLLVLVVDDEPLMRWALSATLGEAGHVVREAVDEAAAVRLVLDASPPFDVVLLGLPPRESLDVTALRTITRHSPTSAVIVMTANDTDAIRDRAAALGGSRVLITPFDLRHVADVLRVVTARPRAHGLHADQAPRLRHRRGDPC